jgi:hypothetical protein
MTIRRCTSLTAAVAAFAITVAACGSSHSNAGVPSLGHGTSTNTSGQHNAVALHAAAQCIRDHGVPNYADPVIGPGNVVYSDQRSFEKVSPATVSGVRSACQSLVAAANWDPTERPHPPAQMVRDGVREAECFRAHGLPNWPDPKPTDTFDPGHGFQVTESAFAGAVAPGENPKQSPVFQNVARACQAEVDATTRDSQLSNLAHGQ